MSLTRGRIPTAVVDAGLGVVTAVLLVGEVIASPTMTPRPLLAPSVLLVAVAAAGWRAWPGAAAVLAAIGALVAGALTTSEFAPQITGIPLLLLMFNAGSRLRGRRAWAYGVSVLALVVAGHIAAPDGEASDFWPWLLWVLAWGGGVAVRRRTDAARAEAALAALFEVEARTSAADATQRERERIARELHDVVAHSVSVMVVQAGAERLRLAADPGETGQALAAIEDAGRQALGELRMLLGLLGKDGDWGEDARPLPRLGDVPALVERLSETGLPVELVLAPDDVLTGRGELPDALELAAYRIVQESLTNVVRHAGSVPTRVQPVEEQAGSLLVSVVNKARPGRSDTSPGAGRGVAGMAERARTLGGELTAGPLEGSFVVEARLPLRIGRGVRP